MAILSWPLSLLTLFLSGVERRRFYRIPIIFGCIYRALLFLQFCHCLSEIAQCCTYVDLKKTEEKQNTHLAVGVPTVCYFANSISEEGKKTERKWNGVELRWAFQSNTMKPKLNTFIKLNIATSERTEMESMIKIG